MTARDAAGPVASADDDADERRCGQDCLTVLQKRPGGRDAFESAATESAGLRQPGCHEALRDRLAEIRPDQRAELVRG
jgi:hypothetical protein